MQIPDAQKKPIQTARVLLANDKTRSLRLARLMIANWLAEADKPASQRAKLFRSDPPIFDIKATASSLTPSELSDWLDTSLLASRFFRGMSKSDFALDNERIRQARLVVHLATELYKREHGKAPESPRELVGPYLKSLPEGYDATAP